MRYAPSRPELMPGGVFRRGSCRSRLPRRQVVVIRHGPGGSRAVTGGGCLTDNETCRKVHNVLRYEKRLVFTKSLAFSTRYPELSAPRIRYLLVLSVYSAPDNLGTVGTVDTTGTLGTRNPIPGTLGSRYPIFLILYPVLSVPGTRYSRYSPSGSSSRVTPYSCSTVLNAWSSRTRADLV